MKYQANPVIVDAFEIVSVKRSPGGSFHVGLSNGEENSATAEMCSRMTPRVGDYWVIQADGYVYLNPKDVFERKYHPIEEAASASQ